MGREAIHTVNMPHPKASFTHKTDALSEEMAVALLAKHTYTFHDLFKEVHEALRARKTSSGGEDKLRLRLYERLQNWVTQGFVNKAQKEYTGVAHLLQARAVAMAKAKAQNQEWKAAKVREMETALRAAHDLPA